MITTPTLLLPRDFVTYTSNLFGSERWARYLAALEGEDAPVSIRLNPYKKVTPFEGAQMQPVPWCRNGYYLAERPNFTLDPLLHAGAYYVQEASSMFLDELLRQCLPITQAPLVALDLCAAPGGKSTLLRAALPESAMLFSNEPDRRRANILMENMQKQGHPQVVVTNSYPQDYRKANLTFDLVLADVPCSGEGMFRKDPDGAVAEWSTQNVLRCAALQRSIIKDVWECIKPGGLLIYSTCTFNLHENEENIQWICKELGAEVLPITVKPEWGITGSLLDGWQEPVYRFIPGTTKGEGLFMAAMRKTSGGVLTGKLKTNSLRILCNGQYHGTQKGKTLIPDHAEALLYNLPNDKYPRVELSLDTALRYLRHEAITLPNDAPHGFLIVTFKHLPLGFVKNIGTRANNLYPPEWKIRNL